MKDEEKIISLLATRPFVWTTGVGKSAAIADCLARYLRNIGIPAAFMCPLDYWHGGRGGVKPAHAMVTISTSGKTAEIVRLAEDSACPVVQVGTERGRCDLFWRFPIQDAAACFQVVQLPYRLIAGLVSHLELTAADLKANHPA